MIDLAGRVVDTLRPPFIAQTLFQAAVTTGRTLWLADADLLIRTPEELPEDARRAADALGVSSADAFVLTRQAWGKVDLAARQRVGSAGELAIVKLLTGAVDANVRHVAADSDGFGYDVSVESSKFEAHLEVKATTRRSRLSVFLSRYEYETMCRDADWALTAVRLDHDLELVTVATIARDWILATVPCDRGSAGRWESARLEVPAHAIVPGLPIVRPVLLEPFSRLLTGES